MKRCFGLAGVTASGDPGARQRIGSGLLGWAAGVLVLLSPFSVYWPLGRSAASDVLEIYVAPAFYLSDIGVGAVWLAALLGGNFTLWGVRRHSARLTIPLVILVGLAVLTTPTALSPTLAGYTVVRWILALGVYLALARGTAVVESVMAVLFIGLGFHALIGLGQILKQGPLGLPGELALEPARSGAAVIVVGGVRWLRAYGLTFHPNVLGGYLTIGLLTGLPRLRQWRWRLWWWVLWLGLLLSFSRAAWLSTALALGLAASWLWRQPAWRRPLGITLIGALVLALVVAALLVAQIQTRLRPLGTPSEFRSLSERGLLIGVAIDQIVHQPWIGVGAGNFPLAVLSANAPVTPQPVHNVPLLLMAEVGLLGGGVWLWLWLAPELALARFGRNLTPWLLALIYAWLAWGVIGLWDSYPWALETGRLLSVTLLGLISQTRADRL